MRGRRARERDWSGDGPADVLAVDSGGRLLLYRATADGRFAAGGGQPIGTGWGSFTALLAPGDWSGDRKPDLLARNADGALLMYRGNGAGGFLTGHGEPIGSGWQSLTALLTPRDFSGDGRPDLLARTADGALLMYRGNGSGGFLSPTAQPIGSGWQGFTALFAGGDFSGDGRPDLLARDAGGALFVYRGDGRGGFITGRREPIGSGWSSLGSLTLVWDPPPAAPPPPPAPAAPPGVPLTDGSAKLYTGKRCTRPGGRLYARVFYRRAGSRKLRHKTISKRFRMCARAR